MLTVYARANSGCAGLKKWYLGTCVPLLALVIDGGGGEEFFSDPVGEGFGGLAAA
jgi:hypothetical protein